MINHSLLSLAKNYLVFTFAFLVYCLTGKTPSRGYQAMIYLFCRTQGRFNDRLSRLITYVNPPEKLTEQSGVLGKMTLERLEMITNELNVKGYYVFHENQLSEEMCERLLKLSLELSPVLREVESHPGEKFNRQSPRTIRYDFKAKDLLQNEDVQALVADPTLELLARSYLKANPIIDIVTMWWNTAFSGKASKEAAQYYHFDLDRFKWLKFFFYITDVGPEQGPHTYITGSQLSGGIPEHLLRAGYSRLEDSAVESCYKKDSIKVFTGLRGSIIAEDTRGLHKGKNVTNGDRLMFQLQFSNCMFGSVYEKAKVHQSKNKKFKELLIEKSPLIRNYI